LVGACGRKAGGGKKKTGKALWPEENANPKITRGRERRNEIEKK
jgi:hypothetical protein